MGSEQGMLSVDEGISRGGREDADEGPGGVEDAEPVAAPVRVREGPADLQPRPRHQRRLRASKVEPSIVIEPRSL